VRGIFEGVKQRVILKTNSGYFEKGRKKGEGTNADDFEEQTRGFGKNQKFVKRWNLLLTNGWRSLTAQLFIAL
jgi:hypothetical protein